MRPRPLPVTMAFVFCDPVRPLEILYMVSHFGWAQFLFRQPELLQMDNYSSLAVLPAWFWGVFMLSIGAVQLTTMIAPAERMTTLRFLAMALSAGMWTLIAIGFWTSMIVTFGAIVYSAYAVLAALAGLLLGSERQVRS